MRYLLPLESGAVESVEEAFPLAPNSRGVVPASAEVLNLSPYSVAPVHLRLSSKPMRLDPDVQLNTNGFRESSGQSP